MIAPVHWGHPRKGADVNVLYLHTHDTGRVVSPYGYAVDTPSYQNLCDDALLFQRAYCAAPTCSPSRAALLTGTYPHQNGMLGLAQRGFGLDETRHLARLLRDRGFCTALCGVQHEFGYYTDHDKAYRHLGYELDLSTDAARYDEKHLVYWDAANAASLAAWLESYHEDRPFFVSYGMHATHREWPDAPEVSVDNAQPPLNIPNNEITRGDFARYKESVRMADANVGMVVDALKKSGRYEDTIIILTTDHGVSYPFEKCCLKDLGTGVVLAIRVPGSAVMGKSFDGLVSHVDVLPTLLDLLGINKPDYLEGRSLAGIFSGEEVSGDEAVFSEVNFHASYEPMRSVRTERYKYIRYFDTTYLQVNRSNIDGSTVKQFYEDNGLMDVKKDVEALYDLYYDVYEMNNLAGDARYADVLEDMRARLAAFMEKTDDPLLNGPIAVRPEWKVNRRESRSSGSSDPNDYESRGLNFKVRERNEY